MYVYILFFIFSLYVFIIREIRVREKFVITIKGETHEPFTNVTIIII